VAAAQEYWQKTAQPLEKRELPARASDAQPSSPASKKKAAAAASR
jgi:hypothetical protein